MPDNLPPVLNLDELFGPQQERLQVRWGAQNYTLRRPQDLGPAEMIAVQRLSAQLTGHENDPAAVVQAAATALGIISPELAALDIPFLAQVQVLQYFAAHLPKVPPGA